MIDIVVCDDDKKHRASVVEIVNKFMRNSNIHYTIDEYSDYNEEFEKVITVDSKKIYILDIETPSGSGIDMARLIRKYDTDSMIIFVTAHEQLGQLVLKRNIMCLSFINKFDGLEDLLVGALNEALTFLDTNKILRIVENNVTYNIKMSSILYFTRDSLDRKTIVITDKNEYKLKLSLRELKELVGDYFVQTHRSCFINESRAELINRKKKIITFDTGLTIDLVSDSYRKEFAK